MTRSARSAWANLGAEEPTPPPIVPGTPQARLARAFEALVADPPWPALQAAHGLVPWLATAAAAAEATRVGLPLAFAPPDVVARVHDKAFALSVAQHDALGQDDVLTPLAVALDAVDVTAARIDGIVAAWPAWAQARFTLKPRHGTSGRGRVPGRDGRLDDAGRAGLDKLRARGGCIVEPFVRRARDASALFVVAPSSASAPSITLLGSTEQEVTGGGLYRGCVAHVQLDGALRAGTPFDAALERDAHVVVAAAARAGFFGFCGVDAFSYRDGASVRTVVELNARFTAGHIALGLMGRRHARPGTALRFALDRDALVSE